MGEVEWQRLKAHELRALAEQGAVVILPVASIEQHGPHLPTMTDTRLGAEIALRAARKAVAGGRAVVVTPVVALRRRPGGSAPAATLHTHEPLLPC